MATMQVEIVSAEEDIFSGEAELVIAPAEMGDVGVMPQHTPLITRLRPGEVRLQTQGEEERFYFVSGGILDVQPHVVTVLADTAIRAKDLDEAQAREAERERVVPVPVEPRPLAVREPQPPEEVRRSHLSPGPGHAADHHVHP